MREFQLIDTPGIIPERRYQWCDNCVIHHVFKRECPLQVYLHGPGPPRGEYAAGVKCKAPQALLRRYNLAHHGVDHVWIQYFEHGRLVDHEEAVPVSSTYPTQYYLVQYYEDLFAHLEQRTLAEGKDSYSWTSDSVERGVDNATGS